MTTWIYWFIEPGDPPPTGDDLFTATADSLGKALKQIQDDCSAENGVKEGGKAWTGDKLRILSLEDFIKHAQVAEIQRVVTWSRRILKDGKTWIEFPEEDVVEPPPVPPPVPPPLTDDDIPF